MRHRRRRSRKRRVRSRSRRRTRSRRRRSKRRSKTRSRRRSRRRSKTLTSKKSKSNSPGLTVGYDISLDSTPYYDYSPVFATRSQVPYVQTGSVIFKPKKAPPQPKANSQQAALIKKLAELKGSKMKKALEKPSTLKKIFGYGKTAVGSTYGALGLIRQFPILQRQIERLIPASSAFFNSDGFRDIGDEGASLLLDQIQQGMGVKADNATVRRWIINNSRLNEIDKALLIRQFVHNMGSQPDVTLDDLRSEIRRQEMGYDGGLERLGRRARAYFWGGVGGNENLSAAEMQRIRNERTAAAKAAREATAQTAETGFWGPVISSLRRVGRF